MNKKLVNHKEDNQMEKYESLELEIIEFDTEDVITTSNPIELPDIPSKT